MTTELALVVDGQRFTNWLSYEADAELGVPAAAWVVTVRMADAGLLATVSEGAWVEGFLGSESIFSGHVDDVITNHTRTQSLLTLRGRDQTALLLGESAPLGWTFTEITLQALLTTVAQHVGMTKPPTTTDTGNISAKAEPGESCWEFIERIARRRGLRLWLDPDGTLNAGQYSTTGTSIGQLQRKLTKPAADTNNILSGSVTRSIKEGASKITVVGSWDDDRDAYSVSGSHSDDNYPYTREIIVIDSDVESVDEATKRATEEMTRRKARALIARYRVATHSDANGSAINPNQLIDVVDECNGLNETMFITGRRFVKSRKDGTYTSLKLQRGEYFDG